MSDFVTTLRLLLERATPGPWDDSGHLIIGQRDANDEAPCIGAFAWEWDKPEGKANKAMVLLLRNHADAILRVVEAAKAASRFIDHSRAPNCCEVEGRLFAALAALDATAPSAAP